MPPHAQFMKLAAPSAAAKCCTLLLSMYVLHPQTDFDVVNRKSFFSMYFSKINFFFFLDRISSPETQATVTALEKPQLCTPKPSKSAKKKKKSNNVKSRSIKKKRSLIGEKRDFALFSGRQCRLKVGWGELWICYCTRGLLIISFIMGTSFSCLRQFLIHIALEQ